MAALQWAMATERAVGRGSPIYTDVVNRALRQLLTESGYDPDANPFPGLMGPVANVKAYGAHSTTEAGYAAFDSSVGIQAAIATGKAVFFPDGVYLANNLTQTVTRQRLFAVGSAQIIKNANGPILASSGSTVQCVNLQFRGEAATPVFTGDNVTFSGPDCSMVNCGSRWAYGRAVKATGDRFQIIGTNDIYQTADQTATGYDIEIGVSGTCTLYHEIWGYDSSQATGGILLIDTGSHTLVGGHYGKLTIQAGTSPAGVNGGKTIGGRILGDVTIGQSGATFSGNQFGIVVVTINATVSGVSIDESNTFQVGATLINNGVAANPLVRSLTSPGGYINLKYGDDASVAIVSIDPSLGIWDYLKIRLPNNTGWLRFKQTSGADGGQLYMTNADRVQLENMVANKDLLYVAAAGTGAHRFMTNGGTDSAKVDHSTTAGQTRLLLYDVDNATLERVTVGIADSGGAGFKVLRIPN